MTVPAAYRHHPKQACAGPFLHAGAVGLKWYRIASESNAATPEMDAAARRFACRSLKDEAEACGFAILHRCGTDFHFLLLSVWREANELWEAVFFCDAGMETFAPFGPAYPDLSAPRPTFCVWELGVVAHEARAWTRFLVSDRTEHDGSVWRGDVFAGQV